jgi:hypothetical protein
MEICPVSTSIPAGIMPTTSAADFAWGAVNDNRSSAGQPWLSPKIAFWFFINGHGKPGTAVVFLLGFLLFFFLT